MFIKTITLNNYRIYKGEQSVSFETDPDRNIYIITGNNGYGKTSFLTSLIWCLYGKNMQEVDDTFRVSILELGGYKKYIKSCLNLSAMAGGENTFSVGITFTDISVPGLAYNEVSIKRSYDIAADLEILEILIDGQENELVQEVGKEIFIHDFVLPKEIAKFFFFDAEKNVSLAETQSLADKRNLSKAYSEILGIKKYEELKNNLFDLRLRYRKSSAQSADAEGLEKLETEILSIDKLKHQTEEKIQELLEQKEGLKSKSDKLQEKLIREGSTITLDQIKLLQARKKSLGKEYEAYRMEFNEMMELAPFAIAGNLMAEVEAQLLEEAATQQKNLPKEIVSRKIRQIKEGIKDVKPEGFVADRKTRNFYEKAFSDLLEKHLMDHNKKNATLHLLDKEETSHFLAIMENLRSSYRIRLSDVNRKIKNNRFEFSKVNKQLIDAEAKETDKVIANYRNERKSVDEKFLSAENELLEAFKELGAYEHQYANKKRVLEEMSKKVQILDRYTEKDALAARLIDELDTFLLKIKNEKRIQLEQRILEGLNALMHKDHFVTQVQVNIENEIIDIELFHNKEHIVKENLSKGEQQLYATALLKALVEESNIKFPVFIDSPMQKYDALHASKVISEFYPTISEQVVIFPLLYKEMTELEYKLLLPFTKAAYMIVNNEADGSSFRAIEPIKLFKQDKLTVSHAS